MNFTFDIHVHTNNSDGINTAEEIIKAAADIGLNGIAITDHDRLVYTDAMKRMATKLNLILIPGTEITTPMGDIIALGIEKMPAKPKKNDVIENIISIINQIHEMGGVAVMAHPFGGYWHVSFAQRIEKFRVMDKIQSETRSVSMNSNSFSHKNQAPYCFDAIEIFNASTPLEANIAAMEFANRLGLPGTGGSDAHVKEMVGTAFTVAKSRNVVDAIRKRDVKVGWL